ncbi:hypothetical protein JQV27_13635 [Sulfitobacter mediterraneus]|jgi:hypothetical protein|uniref:RipA family octameric membrane protein n=1 Tax=Sulfitobacter mediterraneus TaxID=83219 RepID=UPI001931B975|nr:hypothetical protein [Sulfitobacter mediterraneus]MBM1633809.1 hypothetical protein [Sulfitobacter mediterraneus]MBM1641676.1 hypothetical protein [Sulfitobacter mediterraneus]MBM1645673.1 hypothetical protein [Sulfitobacter mediterraneus]MBM1649795.1 hypothetical protein [Sulfitobacter mediterraneus]MBM1653742.1 hypothetical protein [Sulfitobacter mediterraneus]
MNRPKEDVFFDSEFRERYLEELGISSTDKIAVKEAYETAHRIREFEIELYWKRTAYLWAMQAALIGIAMFLWTAGDTTISLTSSKSWSEPKIIITTNPSNNSLWAITVLSSLSLTIAWLWAAVISGAKFWQNNWERHVDILGHALGQNLYQVYPLQAPETIPPFSVTKVNRYIVAAFICFWNVNLLWSLWELASVYSGISPPKLTIVCAVFVSYVVGCIFFLNQFVNSIFYSGLRMSRYGAPVEGLPKGPGKPELHQRSRLPRQD